ncbi:MAG: hypothetical protein J6T76_06420 [Paludibacteraceae bacterium]|nr:hypothetical protein [Paludibacteraceae bacterium]
MKKFLSLVSALALSAFAFAATTVTMDFSDPTKFGYDRAAKDADPPYTQVKTNETISQDGVVLTASYSSGNGFRFYTSTSDVVNLRGYVGATLTVTPPSGKKLLKIKAAGSNLNTTYLAAGEGKISGTLWEGEADAVVFDVIKSTVQINTMTVDFGDAGETPIETKIDTIGVSEAIARIKASNKGECYVKGVVAGDPFLLGGNGPAFYMTDIANAADSLEGFKIGKDANTPYASVEAMAADFGMGDTILIYAAGLDKYNQIFETTSGYFCKVLGKSAAIVLDWAAGTAYQESTGWTLEIAKGNNDQNNLVNLKINSTKKDAIAGSYPLVAGSEIVLNGTKTDITAGNVKVTFKEIGVNSLNIYDVQASFTVGEKVYRIMGDVEFFAADETGEEIVLIGDRPYVPKENEELTCAQAKEYAFSLASGATGEVTVIVKGYVTKVVDATTFWMDDEKGSKQTFEAYKVKNVTPAGQTVVEGALVKLTGKVTNYNGTTAEIKDGSVEIVSGGEEIKADEEVTVAQALAIAQALEAGKTSDKIYGITGYVTEIIYAYDTQHGDLTFWMNDNADDGAQTFQAYQVKCSEEVGTKITAGAKVRVVAKITHFYQPEKPAEGDQPAKPERTIYETAKGGTVELLAVSGVEDVMSNAPAVKFIENGQIYILRNGVRYNLQGQVAE